MIFITFFSRSISIAALFKNAFLGLDLAGKPFGGDFQQLSPWKMKKMFPIARLASGVSTGGRPFGVDVAQLSPCKMKKKFPIARLASGVSTGGCRP